MKACLGWALAMVCMTAFGLSGCVHNACRDIARETRVDSNEKERPAWIRPIAVSSGQYVGMASDTSLEKCLQRAREISLDQALPKKIEMVTLIDAAGKKMVKQKVERISGEMHGTEEVVYWERVQIQCGQHFSLRHDCWNKLQLTEGDFSLGGYERHLP